VLHRLRLLDWPADAALPQRGFNVNKPEYIGHPIIKDGLRRREEDTGDYPRVVSWTDAEMQLTEGDIEWSTIPVVVDSTQARRVHASRSKAYLGPVKRKKKKSRLIDHRPTTLEVEDEDMQSDSNDSHGTDEDHPPPKRAKSRRPQSESGPQPAGSQRAPPPPPPVAPVARSSAPSGAGQPVRAAQRPPPVAPPPPPPAPEAFAQMQQMFTLFQQQFGHMFPGANNPVAGPSNSSRNLDVDDIEES
ncbi:hypothetical protein H0H92_014310, partial [Tricholoma furcatifolium]